MLRYASKLNKKLIYKLHVQNDKIIDMPMFLVDYLYLRSTKELIILLSNAISFNRTKFLENYKGVLLKDKEIAEHCFDAPYDGKNISQGAVKNGINVRSSIVGNRTYSNYELFDHKSKCKNNHSNHEVMEPLTKHHQMKKDSIFKNVKMSPCSRVNCYKYNNEEYDQIIIYLSENYNDTEEYSMDSLQIFEVDHHMDHENDENCVFNYKVNKKEREQNDNKEKNTVIEYSPVEHSPVEHSPVEHSPVEHSPVEHSPVEHSPIEHSPIEHSPIEHSPNEYSPNEYSLIGYMPNDFFFQSLKNRIISLKDYLSYNDLFAFIYHFSQMKDISILKMLGEQYIHKKEKEKDKKNNYKHVVHLLNIYLKLNYKNMNAYHIIQGLVQNIYLNVLTNDLKLSALGFTCLSKLHLYNMLFYDYAEIFLKNINQCSHLHCSMVLHCLGYFKHYWIMKRKELFESVRFVKNSSSSGKETISRRTLESDNNTVFEEKMDRAYDIKINSFALQLRRQNMALINELESKIIHRLVNMDLECISEKSISSIFHFYFLSKRDILNDVIDSSGRRENVDNLLFGKLVHILIKNKMNFDKPRRLLMCCYTLIIHNYFSNIHIASYFVMQCAKLIKWLKEKIYIDNLLFVLSGFRQNQMIFYQNRKNRKNNFRIYFDKKKNKLCNFKIENKYIDMLEKCEYEINILEKGSVEEPVSCRSAILYIFNEITNLNYELNKDQILLYLELFSSFDIKLSTDIKQKLFHLIMNSSVHMISSIHLIFQLVTKIYGISSSYMKTIALHFLEKMDYGLCKLYKLAKNNQNGFFNYIKYGYDNPNTSQLQTYLCDIDKIAIILFIFDQIDIHNKEFIVNISNLMYANNFMILTYKKSNFNSFVYMLHYIGSLPLEMDVHKKLTDFIFTSIEAYINLSYKKYVQNEEKNLSSQKNDKLEESGTRRRKNTSEEHSNSHSLQMNSTYPSDDSIPDVYCSTDEGPFFNEVDHAFMKGKIYVKDLILLLDSIRICKAYNFVSLLSCVTNMINMDGIKTLSDEDVELVNYIYIDMGLMNKCVMDEARGQTIGMNS
ncbi:hypothetical protein, conserved [Plasmodium gonderi]|uniref:Uncharacterized protein n=1 Tax=Plasmodium gonderi TaxID=77519 RepID=A0A1Y1JA67_PLAGO|nr:hypothetical protein, conserved [Plasmodium gonderi]GAW79160.1 hypothetical protein, conserved [Plasmodium gonderi]